MQNSEQRNQKPTLPIGWKFRDQLIVSDFLERSHFTEVYRLSDGSYLYLFKNETISQKITERQIDHEVVKVAGATLFAKHFETHSSDQLQSRIKAILERQGFQAIAGMNDLKALLMRDVVHPFLHRSTYQKYKLAIPNGILLFGPPGCGKTYIVKRLAEEMEIPVFEIRESSVGSPYIHATSGNIARVFQNAFRAAPSIVFIDELSGMLPRRESLSEQNHYREVEINEFLMNLQSAGSKDVLVIGATNFPERLDQAAIRSGRMDKRIFVPPPDYGARIELLRMELEERPLDPDIVLEILARLTEGFVASDIKLVVDNAARKALSKNEAIRMDSLREAIEQTSPSLSQEELERFMKFQILQRI